MKIRNGFVSNSSSSSFIVALGRITDEAAYHAWAEKNGVINHSNYDYDYPKIVHTSDLLNYSPDGKNEDWEISEMYTEYDDGKIHASYFNGEVFSLPVDLSKEEIFIVIRVSNDEGDEEFEVTDDVGNYVDMDYNIDPSHFPNYQQKFFELRNQPFISDFHIDFGVERNG